LIIILRFLFIDALIKFLEPILKLNLLEKLEHVEIIMEIQSPVVVVEIL